MISRTSCSILAAISFLPSFAFAADQYDIVIYGGTSGGIAAGIQAAGMGRTTVIIEPTKFVGGLTTGGLGATDIGNKQAIGGLAREFYHRIWQYYRQPDRWKQETREKYFAGRPHGNSADEETMWTFEPHAATEVYEAMLKEAKVPLVFSERLDLKNGVQKEGARITAIRMESGRTFTGKMFIDATYEGDLMAKAGVSYHVGRESNATYGETLNGIQTARAKQHQFIKSPDPYIKPGDPQSGLLPGIHAGDPGIDGQGDKRVQTYNLRMCTTDIPENRVPWEKPQNYDPVRYELLLRNFEAGDHRSPWNPVWLPNRKTDTNNNFAFSTDNIGMNYDYPNGDYATRDHIQKEHLDYQMGLMWTLANHPRVPEKIRAEFSRLSPAKDEFKDNNHWPRQLYIREARRLIGEYVMTEKNCTRAAVIDDSAGMGAYNMDSHNTQRYVTKDGRVLNEGDIQVGTRPYPVSYRSLCPKAAECTNLLVPVCLSASHIAYGSIRMEPVFMVLGQSAATAASQAIEAGVGVQGIDRAKFKARLLADKQVLDFVSPAAPERKPGIPKDKLPGVVVDDTEAERTGFTTLSTAASPYTGSGYAHDGNTDKGKQRAIFKAVLPKAGKYEVRFAYTALPNRASNVPVTVKHSAGDSKATVNERKTPGIEGMFVSLGTWQFDKAGVVEVSNDGTDGHVIIDAIQWLAVP
ncbi:MAG TPA: FAD-dependent oxidoreductase [Verrucomicrobiales bacterium]|nr:FAD-dependent oxidoreductase [Verrucomicrobiales bacterium]